MSNVLFEPQVWKKLESLEAMLGQLLTGVPMTVPGSPGRDLQILAPHELPNKKGLNSPEGQGRLLHDLASIELQAMELGVRTLVEFPEVPDKFRAELADVARDEGRHLRLCLEALVSLGFPWGSFPAHIGLWNCVSEADTLLDRIWIVHRYLEGSGLDASATLLRRLSGVPAKDVQRVVQVIRDEEVAHVEFGSRWYHHFVELSGCNPEEDFQERFARLKPRLPRRLEPINSDLRRKTGFLDYEIESLQNLRSSQR